MCKVWKVANILFIYASHENCIRKITMSLLPLLFGLNLWVLITNANLTFQRSNAGIRRVSDIVDEIDSNVIEIDLSDNEITRIYHRNFANFRRCRKLNLFRNNIHTLDVGAFEGMVSLYQLILWGNKLTSFPNLTDIPRLQTLSLSGNKLFGTLPSDVQVSNIIQLETLHLDLNNIESAPAEFFANFPVLKTLHISQNSLSRVPQIHSVAGKLEHLNLGDNPIQTAHSSDFVRHGGHSALKTLSWYNPTDFEGTVSFDDDVFFNLDSIETLSLLNLNFRKLPDLSKTLTP